MKNDILMNGVIRQAHYKLANEVQPACRQRQVEVLQPVNKKINTYIYT
jgi:hypothetical protein